MLKKLTVIGSLAAVGCMCLFSGCEKDTLQDFYEKHRGDNLYDLDAISADWRQDKGSCYVMTTNLNASGDTYIFLRKPVKVFRVR